MEAGGLERLPDAVRSELARRGIGLEELAGTLDVRRGEALLLTGSYATGEANPTSDLDFLVLTPDRSSRRAPGATNHPSTYGDSFDRQVGGLLVNVEYVAEPRLADLCQVVNGARRHAGPPDLPNLQPL